MKGKKERLNYKLKVEEGKFTHKLLSNVGNTVFSKVLEKRLGWQSALFENWRYIVGSELALNCYPSRLHWPHRPKALPEDHPLSSAEDEQAILVLACDGAKVTEILHLKDEIIKRINRYLGCKLVKGLRFVQMVTPSCTTEGELSSAEQIVLSEKETQSLQDMVSSIENPCLQRALLELGNHIYVKKYQTDKAQDLLCTLQENNK